MTQGIENKVTVITGMKDPVISRYWSDEKFRHFMAHMLCLDDIAPSRCSAIFFAGDHGTM